MTYAPINGFDNWFIDDSYYSGTVCNSVVCEMLKKLSPYFNLSLNDMGTILITHESLYQISTPPPITIPKHLYGQDYISHDHIIVLTSQNTYWSMIMFQLAHEALHALAGCYPVIDQFKWISEVFCELSSLFACESFRHYPHPESIGYKPDSFDNYYNGLIQEIDPCDGVLTLYDLYQKYKNELPIDPYGKLNDKKTLRIRNLVLAKKIYDYVGCDANVLSAVTELRNLDYASIHTDNDFFTEWVKRLQLASNLGEHYIESLADCFFAANP